MKGKTFPLACWLSHLVLLWGTVVVSDANTNTAIASTPTTPSATPSSGATTRSSPASTTDVTSTVASTTISPGTSTTASTAASVTNSTGTSTPATTSDSPSTGTASPGNNESLQGPLRPWEVALIALASVAMGVILSTGMACSLRSSPCIRNLSTDPYHRHGPNMAPCAHGYRGVKNVQRATGPDALELTGGHCCP